MKNYLKTTALLTGLTLALTLGVAMSAAAVEESHNAAESKVDGEFDAYAYARDGWVPEAKEGPVNWVIMLSDPYMWDLRSMKTEAWTSECVVKDVEREMTDRYAWDGFRVHHETLAPPCL